MSTSLVEIAMDIAAQYPAASSQHLADIIIDEIEFGSLVPQTISHVVIPTPANLRQAEFRSERLPYKGVTQEKAKERAILLEHIDNARLFRHLKSFYTVPIENTGLVPIIGLDGARVAFLPTITYPDRANEKIHPQYPANVQGTKINVLVASEESTTSEPNIGMESPARSTREVTFSAQGLLHGIRKGGPSHLMSLYDIYRIIALLQLYPDDEQVINEIDEALRSDIKIRNQESKSDCIKELFRGDDQLPDELRLRPANAFDILAVHRQRIRAIILDEYRRLQAEAGQKFVKGEITYAVYLQEENKFATNSNDLLAAL